MAEETIEATMRNIRAQGSVRSGLSGLVSILKGTAGFLKKAAKKSLVYGTILTTLGSAGIALEQFGGPVQKQIGAYMVAKDNNTIHDKPGGEHLGPILTALESRSPAVMFQNYETGLPGTKIVLTDRKGKPFAQLRQYQGTIDNDRIVMKKIPLEHMSRYLTTAVVAAEDRRFENHYAWDVLSLVKSVGLLAKKKVLKDNSRPRGASTIEVQLASMILCDPRYDNACQDSSNYKTKTAELLVATELEAQFTKKELLEKYLNFAYFGYDKKTGGHLVGVEVASLHYFGKTAQNLDILESALLASMIKMPGLAAKGVNQYYASQTQKPVRTTELQRLKVRAQYALEWMLKESETGNFTKPYYKPVTEEEIVDAIQKLHYDKLPFRRSESIEKQEGIDVIVKAVRDELEELHLMQQQPESVRVQTTVDLDLQRYATEQLKEEAKRLGELGVPRTDLLNGILTVVDSETREVLAFARYFGDENKFRERYHIGSTAKPFVAWAYLEQGGSLEDELPDFKGKTFRYEARPGVWKTYAPKNFGNKYTHGAKTTLEQAVVKSHNIPMVAANEDLLEQHSGTKIRGILNQLGLNMGGYWLSAPLGFEVKPLDLAGAYTAFHDGKVYKFETEGNVTFVKEVEYATTQAELSTQKQAPKKTELYVISPHVLPQMQQTLNKVVTEGTGKKSQVDGYVETQMGKSGTPPGGVIYVNIERVLGVTVIAQFSSAQPGITHKLYEELDKKTKKAFTGGTAMGPVTRETLAYIAATGR